MAETTLSIAAALNQLKILNARIERATSPQNGSFVNIKIGAAVVGPPVMTEQDFIAVAQGNWDSATALITNRAKLKAAIVQSNALTQVTIGGERMTVAKAIERKTSIVYEQKLLAILVAQYDSANRTIAQNNERTLQEAHRQAVSFFADKLDKDSQEYGEFVRVYNSRHGSNLLDPLQIATKIQALQKQIEDFESQVDLALTTSNVTTMITVDLA